MYAAFGCVCLFLNLLLYFLYFNFKLNTMRVKKIFSKTNFFAMLESYSF